LRASSKGSQTTLAAPAGRPERVAFGQALTAPAVRREMEASGCHLIRTAPTLSECSIRRRARQGMPADFDGDGRAEFVPVLDGMGGVTVADDPAGDGIVVYKFVYDALAVTASYTYDPNGDGTGQISIVHTINNHVIVTTRDVDFDGNPDWRMTRTSDPGSGTANVLIESAPNNDGNFVTVRDTTIPSAYNCGNGVDDGGFPTDAPTVSAGGGIRIRISNGYGGVGDGSVEINGACSNAHAQALEKAIDCALSQSATCLRSTNGMAYFLLDTALAYGTWDLSCGNGCDPGTTKEQNECGPGSGACAPVETSFNPDSLGSLRTDTNRCDLVLHEMLHWAGVPSDDTHPQGVDQVYACARYCGGCDEPSPWAPPGATTSRDCATCANSPDEKAQCGLKPRWRPSKKSMGFVCWGSTTSSSSCDPGCVTPYEDYPLNCDDTVATGSSAKRWIPRWCCTQCGQSCDKNDDICPSDFSSPADCSNGTPFCPR
jgi:hypothetical protein